MVIAPYNHPLCFITKRMNHSAGNSTTLQSGVAEGGGDAFIVRMDLNAAVFAGAGFALGVLVTLCLVWLRRKIRKPRNTEELL